MMELESPGTVVVVAFIQPFQLESVVDALRRSRLAAPA
jgi:hypothetical protein